MAVRMASRPDFVEGVRAVVVDKDRRAAWQQQGWGEVRDAEVEALLRPLPGGERLALGGQQSPGGP
jgi:enoyl-CoA hydratase